MNSFGLAAGIAPAFFLLAPVAAQCSSGPFVGIPLTMSTAESASTGFSSAELYHKGAGFHAAPPTTWAPVAGVADFRLAPPFRACTQSANRFPDVDAMSLGEDWILADDNTGRMNVPANRWGGLLFSVTPRTVGRRNSVIQRESSSAGGAAGDVFSWVLPGSVMPPELVDVTERAQDASEIDVGADDLDALDIPLPMWRLEPGIRSGMLNPPRVFFSVSSATLALVPQFWFENTPPSAATILYMVWERRTQQWSCPRVWKTFRDLGLVVGDDVDALAIDTRNQRILFSTTSPRFDPLMFLYCGTDLPTPVPYTDDQGQPVSDKVGLIVGDEIDAVCAIDPSIRGSANGVNAPYFAIGTPVQKLGVFGPSDIASSAFRTFNGVLAGWRTYASGWPRGTGPGPGFGILAMSLPNGPPGLYPLTVVARNPADPVCGAPVSGGIIVPPVLSITGTPADLRWYLIDQPLTSIGEAFPIRVRL